ncbi:AbrB/MazE/SpoVT family DNA-binding domain-containing protein [Lentisalinibacter orientalis]|jgi:AbrB family looped-hinge helix DNA binding protein|uniref:AbrB/MazE/SpoVT family DNA-binding domain-containing protein n=1 Tax=Lentisalinibacter orientalis TaxID=2992241 RepID=UPI003865C276
METTKVSPKYQVVIPLKVRESLNLKPGTRLQVVQFEDRIELIPLRSARSLRGSLRGLDTDVPRDADRV